MTDDWTKQVTVEIQVTLDGDGRRVTTKDVEHWGEMAVQAVRTSMVSARPIYTGSVAGTVSYGYIGHVELLGDWAEVEDDEDDSDADEEAPFDVVFVDEDESETPRPTVRVRRRKRLTKP